MGRTLGAVGSRSPEKAAAFARKYGAQKAYADFREMFTDPAVDVIYLATPTTPTPRFWRRRWQRGQACAVRKVHHPEISRELADAARLAEQRAWCWPRP